MRRTLSLALVVLLILRGLLGDAMAMGSTPVQGAPEMVQVLHLASGAAHGAHAGQTLVQHCCDPLGDKHPAHQAGCSACGICHSVLGLAAWMAATATGPRHMPRPPRGTPFASAPAAQAIKPPIV